MLPFARSFSFVSICFSAFFLFCILFSVSLSTYSRELDLKNLVDLFSTTTPELSSSKGISSRGYNPVLTLNKSPFRLSLTTRLTSLWSGWSPPLAWPRAERPANSRNICPLSALQHASLRAALANSFDQEYLLHSNNDQGSLWRETFLNFFHS